MQNKKVEDLSQGPVCPIPISEYPQVLLAHGGGGKLMHQLIQKMFASTFDNPLLNEAHDGAVFQLGGAKLAMTTDSYVVNPLFFPGGDIGSLAIHGTVNDLAMCGAKPLYLSVGFILEEGLPMDTLWQIVQSMQQAVERTGVKVVTGDTKVVDKGKGDGIFINTAGVGIIEHQLNISPRHIQEGDAIILNGDIGRHGIAIMASREGLAFEVPIESDSAPVADLVQNIIKSGIEVHCLRDLTRGGLATALIELSETSQTRFEIEELAIPVQPEVHSACEILGLDPLYIANEGRFVVFVPAPESHKTLEIMKKHPLGQDARIIGRVVNRFQTLVVLKSRIGTHRILDMLSGEQLPRIC